MSTPESVECTDVEVAGKMPLHEALAGSAMRWSRKRGNLAVRKELAIELGLV